VFSQKIKNIPIFQVKDESESKLFDFLK
jgi:hypothetical protein